MLSFWRRAFGAEIRFAQMVVASFVSLATTFLCCASKSHLALTPLLLLSKTKPHGRFMPRRQLRHYAVLGFVFGQLLTWICEAKKHASACFFALEARLRRRDPLRSNGRRKLRIACDVFFHSCLSALSSSGVKEYTLSQNWQLTDTSFPSAMMLSSSSGPMLRIASSTRSREQ